MTTNNHDDNRTLHDKRCTECGTPFQSVRQDRRYCSAVCRSRAARRRQRNRRAREIPGTYTHIKRPIIRYSGGKWRIGKWVTSHFPSHTTYVEPFCGAASILFRKEPSRYEIINDKHGEVVNFFDQLRVRPDDLIRAIYLTPMSRYELSRARLPVEDGDMLERARRFFVRSWQSFGSGEGKNKTGWRYQRHGSRNTTITDEWNDLDRLWQAADRLKQVQIECDDAFRVFERFDGEDVLFYVDPPYLFSARANKTKIYAHELEDDQHEDLADVLKSLKGMVVLSGYPSDLYQELYADWPMFTKAAWAMRTNPVTECLWMSPKAHQRLEEDRAKAPAQETLLPLK